jgi:carbon starvation protein CstA
MDNLFVYLLLAAPVLWLGSLLLLKSWRRFWPFFGLNAGLLAAYLYVLGSTNLIDYGHDEYGLGRLFAMLMAVVLHVLLGFVFAVGFRLQQRRAS